MQYTPDKLVRATAGGGSLRIFAATTTNLVNDAMTKHGCYPLAAGALGRTLTGALLFAANLKNKEALTIKFKGDGPLGTVTADATPEGAVRGYVDNPTADLPLNNLGKINVGGGIGQGILSVTRFTGLKEPITGSINIKTGEIADDLMEYLFTSEQTPSCIGLGVLVSPELKCLGSGGFFIQPLPEVTDEILDKLEAAIAKIESVSTMVEHGGTAEDMIREILKDFDDINILSATDLAFRCQCSKMKISDMLITLGEDDLKGLVDDGRAEVRCHFCNEKYEFSKEDLEAIQAVAKRRRPDGTFDTTGLFADTL